MFWTEFVGELRQRPALGGVFFWLDLIAAGRDRKVRYEVLASARREASLRRARERDAKAIREHAEMLAKLMQRGPDMQNAMMNAANGFGPGLFAYQQASQLGNFSLADILNAQPGSAIRYTPHRRSGLLGGLGILN